jgi:hypothetical protein
MPMNKKDVKRMWKEEAVDYFKIITSVLVWG